MKPLPNSSLSHPGSLSQRTTNLLRCFVVLMLAACVSALRHAVTDETADSSALSAALCSRSVRLLYAGMASFPVAIAVESALDIAYFPAADRRGFERFLFTTVTVVSAGAMVFSPYAQNPLQLFLVCETCRRVSLVVFVIMCLHGIRPEIVTAQATVTAIVLLGAMAVCSSFILYAPRGTLQFFAAICLKLMSVLIGLMSVYYGGSLLVSVFKNATRAAAEESLASSGVARSCARLTLVQSWQYATTVRLHHLTRYDLLIMLYVVPPALLLLFRPFREEHISELGESTLSRAMAVQCVLVFLLVVVPSRLMRYDVMNLQQALETKRQLSRHTFSKMRSPLNVVTLGLRLLQNKRGDEQVQGGRAEGCATGVSRGLTEGNVSMSALDCELALCDAEMADLLDSVHQSCSTTIETLNDMLVYDKLGGGVLRLELVCCRVLLFVRMVVQPFLVEAKIRGVVVKIIDKFDKRATIFDPALPLNSAEVEPLRGESDDGVSTYDSATGTDLWVRIDPVKMGQALRNFLSNALKVTPQGGCVSVVVSVMSESSEEQSGKVVCPEASVDAEAGTRTGSSSLLLSDQFTAALGGSHVVFGRDPRRPMLRLSVTDTGSGLTLDTMGRLFQDAVQYEPSDQQRGTGGSNGSGFGLKITKRIVDLHGGSVGASSNGVGKGSTFFANLPLFFLAATTDGAEEVPLDSSLPKEADEADGDRCHKVAMSSVSVHSSFSKLWAGVEVWTPLQASLFSEGTRESLSGPRFSGRLARVGYELPEEASPSARLVTPLLCASEQMEKSLRSSELLTEAAPGAADRAVTKLRERESVRVLLAIRSPVCRGMLRRLLQNLDVRLVVDEAGGGQECVELLRRAAEGEMGTESRSRDRDGILVVDRNPCDDGGYAALILDDELEGLDGIQVAKICRGPAAVTSLKGVSSRTWAARRRHSNAQPQPQYQHSDTPPTLRDDCLHSGLVLGLSGLVCEDDLKKFVAAGADVVMAKPVDVDLFVGVLAHGVPVKSAAHTNSLL